MILVDRLVHGRDLALAESVVERAVDGLRGQTEARSGIAVDDHVRRKPGILLIRTDVGNLRQRARAGPELSAPTSASDAKILRLQRVLILRVALPAADANILRVLQEQRGARHARRLAAEAGDHLVRGGLAHSERLQLHEDTARIVAAESAAAGAGDHRRRSRHRDRSRTCSSNHFAFSTSAWKEMCCWPCTWPCRRPVSCCGKNPLGTLT